jgi:hypothetical protein
MALINLWQGNLAGMPIRYSRTRSDYGHEKRYGQLFFTFDTLKPVIDALEEHGYVEHALGRSRYETKEDGFQTRMWASPKLIQLFMDYRMITPNSNHAEPEELIILNKDVPVKPRKKTKKIKMRKEEVGYIDNKQTIQMRNDLERYRDFVKQHHINVAIPGSEVINYEFLFELYRNILNKRITLEVVGYWDKLIDKPSLNNTDKDTLYQYPIHNYIPYKSIINNTLPIPPITSMFRSHSLTGEDLHRKICFDGIWEFVWFLSRKYRDLAVARKNHDKALREEFQLRGIGIEQLQFSLNQEILYRVFNRGVRSFKYGGRAFGAVYQRIPKHLRRHIYINDEPTVELDFSAYHIRMLYHLLGIDYQDDPYIICGGKKYRKAFKCAALVIINAKDEEEGRGAIKDELIKNGIPFPDEPDPMRWMVQRFKGAHLQIAEFICSDYGVILQNIDGHIMNAILMCLMDKGILGLSMFDSVIVAKQHETALKEAMIREYKEKMGFAPKF